MEDIRFARSILLGVDLEGSGNKDGIRLSGDVVSLRIHIGSPEVRQPFFSPRTCTSRKAWLTKAQYTGICCHVWRSVVITQTHIGFSYLG